MRVFLWKGCVLLLLLSSVATAQGPSLTFDQAFDLAVQRSPVMGAQLASQRAAEGVLRQAGASPNPYLQLQSQSDGFERLSLIGLAVSQTVEMGHKRASRIRVAESEHNEAGIEVEARRRTLRQQLHGRFLKALLAQRKLELADDLFATTDRHLTIARERLRAGDLSGVEVRALEVESERRRAARVLAAGESRTAMAGLAEFISAPGEPLPGVVSGDLGWHHVLPDYAEIQGSTDLVSLRLARARTQTRQAQVGLERSRGVSDVTVQAGVFLQRDYFPGESFAPRGTIQRLDDSGPILQLQLQIPLPLNDNNAGNIDAARARQEQSELEALALERKLEAELQGLYFTLVAQAEARRLLEEQALPQAREALGTVERAYALGFRSQIDLLLARESYLRASDDALAAAFAESQTVVELEALLGHPLPTQSTENSNHE